MSLPHVGTDEADSNIVYQIWRCYASNNSWIIAGRYPTRAEALRATPNWGRAPGWVVVPVWDRSKSRSNS